MAKKKTKKAVVERRYTLKEVKEALPGLTTGMGLKRYPLKTRITAFSLSQLQSWAGPRFEIRMSNDGRTLRVRRVNR